MEEKYFPFDDVIELFKKIKKIHPNMFFKISEPKFVEEVEKSGENWDNLTINEKYYELMRLNALIGDLHTSITMPGSKNVSYPFMMKKCKEGIFVYKITKGFPESVLYSKVLAINDIPIEEVIEMAKKIISSESPDAFENIALKKFCNPTFMQILGVSKNGEIKLTINDGGKVVSYPVFPFVSRTENKSKDYNHAIKIKDDYVLVDIRSFKEQSDNFLSKIYYEVDKAFDDGKPVIVDVRGNGGGKTKLFIPLCDSMRASGGKAFCLIDNNSFSASVVLADEFKKLGGVLVGDTMAQSSTFYSGAKQIITKNGIEAKVSTVLTRGYKTSKGEREIFRDALTPRSVNLYDEAVKPDIQIVPSIEDLKKGRDAAMEYCLNEVRKINKAPKEKFEKITFVP